jgi:hypothetical protein
MTATTTTIHNNEIRPANVSSNWMSLYKLGGATALLAVLVAITDIALTFLPAGAEPPATITAVDWFQLFQENWFFGLRNLGLLPNILTLVLLIPLFLALYNVHQKSNAAYSALALVLVLVGSTIYLANNAAFPMMALSTKYAAATTEAQRTLLAAAGEAILARGEDFTPGAFTGFLLVEIAVFTISLLMLRGGVFSRATAYTGIAGGLFMTIFTIWSTFVSVLFEVAMILAILGGLCYIVWYVLTARCLFQLGSHSS